MKRIKANCRENNYCVFCEFWLGKPANVNHMNGESEIFSGQGLCSKNNQYYEPIALCSYFKRKLLYL